jgi:hypothetical protein
MPTVMALGVPVGLAVSRYRSAKLRRARPTVVGLEKGCRLPPCMIASDGWHNGKPTDITLSYGQLLDTASPLVLVTTHYEGADGLPSLEQEIAQRKYQDAAIDRQDWENIEGIPGYSDDEMSFAPLGERQLEIFAFGKHCNVPVVESGRYSAFQFGYQELTIRFIGRQCPEKLMKFEVVRDLRPSFAGYRKFLVGLLRWEPPVRPEGG